MATQATVTLPSIVKGATMPSRTVTFTKNATSPTITSAILNIRGIGNIECSVSGAVITIPSIPAATTETWAIGVYNWDLETVIAGVTNKYIRGTIEVLRTEK